jgi:hypothetical protein
VTAVADYGELHVEGDVVGELVYWKFVDEGRHVANDEVSVISEIRGKWERGQKEFDGGCRYLA